MHHNHTIKIHLLRAGFLLALAAAALWFAPGAQAAKADRDDPDYVKRLEIDASASAGAKASASTASAYSGTGVNPYTGRTYTQKSLASGMTIVNGVDVSKWNGNINWEKAKAAGIRFAIIRIGYSALSSGKHHKDPWYESNIREAKAAGVKVGVYYFSQARNVAEAKSEASYTLKLLGSTKLDFPVVFDSEDMRGSRLVCSSLSRAKYTSIVRAFCDRVEGAGYQAMVYSNLNGWTNYFYNKELTSRYGIWFARYNTYTGYSGRYDIWQYSEVGRVSGIPGYTDMNFYYCPADKAQQFGGNGEKKKAGGAAVGMSHVTARRSGKNIQVHWGAVSGASRYVITRSMQSNSGFRKVGETAKLSFLDRSAVRGRRYYYRVYAKTGQGTSKMSNVDSASTAAKKKASVRVRELSYVRSGASRSAADIGWLPGGKTCRLLEIVRDNTGKDWYRIRVKFRGRTMKGYISSLVASMK